MPRALRSRARARPRPFPAFGTDFGGERFELSGHEAVEQLRVEQEHALVAFGEEVAPNSAPGFLVCGQGHEPGTLIGRGDRILRERCADVVGIAAAAGQLAQHAFLGGVVVGDGEGLHLLQGQFATAIRLEHVRAHAGKFQTLPDGRLADAEARRDVGHARSSVDQLAEGVELVGRMHRRAHDVLGQADLGGVGGTRYDATRDWGIRAQHSAFGESGQGKKAPASRDDRVLAAMGFPHDERLQHAMRGNRGGELLEAVARSGPSDIAVPRHELGQRYGRDRVGIAG